MDYHIYTVWAASIYALTVAVKATAKANAIDKNSFYVRALPLLPVLIGALSGLVIGPEVFGWSLLQGAFFGIGAAGVAATAHGVHKQTIKGKDARLDHFRDVTKEVQDE